VAYLKSILAGLGAAALAGMALALWAQGLRYRVALSGDSEFVVSHWHKAAVFCALLLVFAAAFWWQYRKDKSN
jgi:heme/copper-type cytochrome/quinol oxidase subunit 1